MTRAEVDSICASLAGATPSGAGELDSWKVADKMFVCFSGEGGDGLTGMSVKCPDTETSAMLIDAGVAVKAPYFHKSWVRMMFDGLDADEARHRIAVSYDTIVSKLTRAQRAAIPQEV